MTFYLGSARMFLTSKHETDLRTSESGSGSGGLGSRHLNQTAQRSASMGSLVNVDYCVLSIKLKPLGCLKMVTHS